MGGWPCAGEEWGGWRLGGGRGGGAQGKRGGCGGGVALLWLVGDCVAVRGIVAVAEPWP